MASEKPLLLHELEEKVAQKTLMYQQSLDGIRNKPSDEWIAHYHHQQQKLHELQAQAQAQNSWMSYTNDFQHEMMVPPPPPPPPPDERRGQKRKGVGELRSDSPQWSIDRRSDDYYVPSQPDMKRGRVRTEEDNRRADRIFCEMTLRRRQKEDSQVELKEHKNKQDSLRKDLERAEKEVAQLKEKSMALQYVIDETTKKARSHDEHYQQFVTEQKRRICPARVDCENPHCRDEHHHRIIKLLGMNYHAGGNHHPAASSSSSSSKPCRWGVKCLKRNSSCTYSHSSEDFHRKGFCIYGQKCRDRNCRLPATAHTWD